MTLLVPVLAGALGALFRYLLTGWVQSVSKSDLPLGTLVVNMLGAFALGVVAGGGDLDALSTLAGAGFLGGFTTFSTWMVETIRLGPASGRGRAVANLVITLLGGIILAAVGYSLVD